MWAPEGQASESAGVMFGGPFEKLACVWEDAVYLGVSSPGDHQSASWEMCAAFGSRARSGEHQRMYGGIETVSA